MRVETVQDGVTVVYGRLLVGQVEAEPLMTAAWSLDVSLRGHERATLLRPGAASRSKVITPGTASVYASGPAAFVGLSGPSEFVELAISRRLRREVAEVLRAPAAADLEDRDGIADPVALLAAARVRAAALSSEPLAPMAAEEIARLVMAHAIEARHGGRRPRGSGHPLDPRRTARVAEFMAANLRRLLTLADLASVAALSRTHFLRAYRARHGLTPSRGLEAMRALHAAHLIAEGTRVADAARAVGYDDNHAFRSAFRRWTGHLPGAHAREGRTAGKGPAAASSAPPSRTVRRARSAADDGAERL